MNKEKKGLLIWLFITLILLLTHILFVSTRLYGAISGIFSYMFLYAAILLTLILSILFLRLKLDKQDSTFKILDSLFFIAKSIMIFTYVLIHFFSFARVDGDSMNPSFYHNDIIFSYQFNYEPKRDDIVIVSINPNTKFLKRIAAVPGDTLEFIAITQKVYFIRINNVDYKDYEIKNTDIFYIQSLLEKGNIMPKDHFFVLGDNAYNSQDSRSLGLFTRDEILAKVIFKIWSTRK